MNEVEKMTMKTVDGTVANIAALKNLFPEIVTEGKVDFDALKTILGGEVAGDERYQFTWAGKRAAMIEAAKPITKTLRPCPEKSKNWDTTQNLYIEGDNLDALKILQATYAGKVKMIYIDPPYNTGKDFIYHDNFHGTRQQEQVKEGTVDAETGLRFKANTESNGYFHSDWCSMMYPRLKLARQLLREDGVVFISIDDSEVDNLRQIGDQVFQGHNFLAEIIVTVKTEGRRYGAFAKTHEYVLAYAKSIENCVLNEIEVEGATFDHTDEIGGFNLTDLRNQNARYFNSTNRPNLRYPFYVDVKHPNAEGLCAVDVEPHDGYQEVWAITVNGNESVWRWGRETAQKELHNLTSRRSSDGQFRIFQKYRKLTQTPKTTWAGKEFISNHGTKQLQEILGVGVFDFPKPMELLRRMVEIGTGESDVVMDFFSGSATTAHAVMRLNAEDGGKRKFIMVQLPELTYEIKNGHKIPLPQSKEAFEAGYENICEIGEKRIDLAGEKIKAENATVAQDLDIGFRVFRVDSSNMEDLYYAPKDVQQTDLLHAINNVKPDRKPIDLLYGCLVDWGLPIDLPHETKTINGHEVFSVGGGLLMACFDQNVDDATVKAIAAEKPSHALFRDASFVSSAAKINVGEIFKALSPETNVRVL